MTLSPAFLVTGMDSPVTMDSSTELRPFEELAVHRNLFAWTDAQAVADMT